MSKPSVNEKAPPFLLPDQRGEMKSLSEFDADYLVLYFYPKDLTPGCVLESREFSKRFQEFKKLGATIVGVSGGTSSSKMKFCGKFKLKQSLLADEDFAVAKSFGAFGKKKFMGRVYDGVFRMTFVISRSGNVIAKYTEVKPIGHAEEVLAFLRSLT